MASKHKIFDYWQGLPPWAKGVVFVGSGLVLYLAGHAVYKTMKRKGNDKDAQQTINSATQELIALARTGVHPSYSDTQYKIWADAAEACYQGWGTCGDLSLWIPGANMGNDTIFINLKNDADVLKLIQAFGIRTISSGKLNPSPDFRGDLPSVMRDELRGDQISRINSQLAKNKISYRF